MVLFRLEITFQSTGGGFRQVLNTNYNPPRPYRTQYYNGVSRTLAVEFRFDFLLPYHCEETSSCTSGESMLDVPDITKVCICAEHMQPLSGAMDTQVLLCIYALARETSIRWK